MTDNFSFIIDLDYVQFEDLKADDLGVWKSTGVKRGDFVITSGVKHDFKWGTHMVQHTIHCFVDTMSMEHVLHTIV